MPVAARRRHDARVARPRARAPTKPSPDSVATIAPRRCRAGGGAPPATSAMDMNSGGHMGVVVGAAGPRHRPSRAGHQLLAEVVGRCTSTAPTGTSKLDAKLRMSASPVRCSARTVMQSPSRAVQAVGPRRATRCPRGRYRTRERSPHFQQAIGSNGSRPTAPWTPTQGTYLRGAGRRYACACACAWPSAAAIFSASTKATTTVAVAATVALAVVGCGGGGWLPLRARLAPRASGAKDDVPHLGRPGRVGVLVHDPWLGHLLARAGAAPDFQTLVVVAGGEEDARHPELGVRRASWAQPRHELLSRSST